MAKQLQLKDIPVKYNLYDYDEIIGIKVSSLIKYPWQVVVYEGRITYILPINYEVRRPNNEIRNNYTEYMNDFHGKHNILNGDMFMTVDSFMDLYGKHPYLTKAEMILRTKEELNEYDSTYNDIDNKFNPLILAEGLSFTSFCNLDHVKLEICRYCKMNWKNSQLKTTALTHILMMYIDSCVDNYNENGGEDSRMLNFINNISKKTEVKQWDLEPVKEQAKETPNKKKRKHGLKFVRGRIYKLRMKGRDGVKSVSVHYKCIQIINDIRDDDVDIVIMKQVTDHPVGNHMKYCLNREDCLKYHIKFELGLEVFSQKLNWIKA